MICHFDVSGILETWKFTSVVEPLNFRTLNPLGSHIATSEQPCLESRPLVCLSFPLRPLLVSASGLEETLRFNELVRLLEQNGFRLIREKGSIRMPKPVWTD